MRVPILAPRPSILAPLACPMSQEFSLGTVEVALSPKERFEEFLQARGKRITKQRRILVEQIARRHEHFDADQLLLGFKPHRRGPQG